MEAFIGIYLGELVFRLDFRLEQRSEHKAWAAGQKAAEIQFANLGPSRPTPASTMIKDRYEGSGLWT